MRNTSKLFGAMFAGFGALLFVSAAFAADATPRAAANVRAGGRVGVQTGRMPSMPIMTINPANISTDVPSQNQPQPQPQPQPDPEPQPEPTPECPDGGVRNSDYTVQNCMNDVLACINNGALAGGLNDLFNEDMRNAIMNGMGLCSIQVEKCMTDVRRDCKPVYRAIADVWVDFNSRKIQPEYYNFVLRKTGLTPNQAENTCLLLDVNTYGPSFAAVANDGGTTNEYNNRVGAYNNQQGGVLIKTNPQGVELNYGNAGVDGARGHYARWDATTATCYLRVAAYNKDTQIKNSWLFGAVGNDEPAQVWRAAGDTFSCNKDLFGFGLMNDTKTTAVVGVGGGTLAGAGIGALAGHGKRAFDCENKSAVKTLSDQLRKSVNVYSLNRYLSEGDKISTADLTARQCRAIVDLYTNYQTVKQDIGRCFGNDVLNCTFVHAKPVEADEDIVEVDNFLATECAKAGKMDTKPCVEYLISQNLVEDGELDINASSCAKDTIGCRFKSLRNPDNLASGLKCTNLGIGCVNKEETEIEIAELDGVFGGLDVLAGEKSNMGKSIATGAAIGAGTGGVATAITAFVERNNINCRVGDGLNTVGFGKSHSIGTLKDFYVKWNLRLPDTVIPTATAVDCKSWKLSCAQYTDLNQCKAAALNYKPTMDGTITLVRSACAVSGSVCIENAPVAASYGACVDAE